MSKHRKTTTKVAGGTKAAKKKLMSAADTTKLARLETLLRRWEGVTLDQISSSIGWQVHSVRGSM